MFETHSSQIRRDNFKVQEVARANGVNQNTIYGAVYEGIVTATRIGRAVRISRSELERLGWAVPEFETTPDAA